MPSAGVVVGRPREPAPILATYMARRPPAFVRNPPRPGTSTSLTASTRGNADGRALGASCERPARDVRRPGADLRGRPDEVRAPRVRADSYPQRPATACRHDADPPRWTDAELEGDRQDRSPVPEERLQEPLEQYLESVRQYRGAVEDLLEATVDLTQLSAPDLNSARRSSLARALRYLAGPPISADDLKELAEASLAARLRDDPDMAQRVIDTILIALDRRRFPWVAEDREPEPAEREAAALASAALIATRRHRRTVETKARTQEQSVADALPRPISRKSQLRPFRL